MQKNAYFRGLTIPLLLLLPQLAITVVFFYWPASQAVWQSFLLQDAFGISTEFVWFENYVDAVLRSRLFQGAGQHRRSSRPSSACCRSRSRCSSR